MRPTLSKKSAGVEPLRQKLLALTRTDVLVGVAQKTTRRRNDTINNAELLFIHSHGSPARRIPMRKVIEPAIAADGNRQAIAAELKLAATAALHENDIEALDHLKRAGVVAMNAAKAWFTDPRNNWAPNKPGTIKRKGSSTPLIDTGALRKSITYVIREVR